MSAVMTSNGVLYRCDLCDEETEIPLTVGQEIPAAPAGWGWILPGDPRTGVEQGRDAASRHVCPGCAGRVHRKT